MVEDAKFWVVRPRISLSGVSGLSTLLSGNYIGFEAGASKKKDAHVHRARGAADHHRRHRPAASSCCWRATWVARHQLARLLPAAAGRPGRRLRPRAGRQVGRAPHLRQRAVRQVRHRGHAVLECERRRRVADRERPRRAHAIARRAARRRHRIRGAAAIRPRPRWPSADTAFTLFGDRVNAMKVDESIATRYVHVLHGVGARPVGRRAGQLLRRSGRRGHRRRAWRSTPTTLDVRPRVEVLLYPERMIAQLPTAQEGEAQAMAKQASVRHALMQQMVEQRGLRGAARDRQPRDRASVSWRSAISRRPPKATVDWSARRPELPTVDQHAARDRGEARRASSTSSSACRSTRSATT